MESLKKLELCTRLKIAKYRLLNREQNEDSLFEAFIQIKEKELFKQKDIQQLRHLYILYLEKMRDLYLFHEISNPLAIATLFSTTLEFFSKTGEFKKLKYFSTPNSYLSLLGPRIMQGSGVCRHVASLFYDFGKLFPLSVSLFSCTEGSLEETKEEEIKNSPPNHLANLILVNGKKMVVDCFNGTNYLFQTKEKLVDAFDPSQILWIQENKIFPQDKDLLLNPSLSKEEFQEEIENLKNSLPIVRAVFNMFHLHQSFKNELEKISQIEENYSNYVYKKRK